jgi:UDPglucose--hexose-1-phosphate uridylyltransferase
VRQIRVDPLSGLRVLFAPTDALPGPVATPPLSVAAGEVVRPDAEAPPREAALDLFTSAAARGHHERLPAAEDVDALVDLSPDGFAATMAGWRARMAAHPEAAHVHLSVDERPGGGPSQAELLALDFVPAAVARERERASAYAARTQGSDLLGDLVQAEVRQRVRLVAYDDEAVLLSPYASRAPFALLLAPRTPARRFEDPGVLGAALLQRGLLALQEHVGAPVAFALWVRTAPRGAEHFSWRIDVLPHLGAPGGLELGTGVPVNPVLPERATAALRAALAGTPPST